MHFRLSLILLTSLILMVLQTASAAPGRSLSSETSDGSRFLVGVYVGTFDSEESALAGWRELPLGSVPEGAAIELDQAAKLVGMRPPARSTDMVGLIYMIVLRQPDGQVQSFFVLPEDALSESPWFKSNEIANQLVAKLRSAGSPMSRVFLRK